LGNIGWAAARLATLIVALRLLWSAPDWYRTWKERQNAEQDLALKQARKSIWSATAGCAAAPTT